MIIEQSNVLQERVRLLNQSDRRRKEIKQLGDTYEQLQIISESILRLLRQFSTVGNLLADEEREEIIVGFRSLYKLIKDLADDFSTNSEQSRKLKTLSDKTVADCTQLFASTWSDYVDHTVSNERDIYILTKNLPDVRANGSTIERTLRRLETFRQKAPSTLAELTDFQEQVESLRSQIENIQGLTSAVQKFLDKMANNSATIADLTPDVLEWCQEPARAKHFVINFADGT